MVNELDLITQAQCGNQQAFGELALSYRKNITGLAYRMLNDITEAEDVTQDVFLKAYLALSKFHYQHEGSFKSWLLTITSRVCIDRLRRQKPVEELLPQQELSLADRAKSIPELVCEDETKDLLRDALLELPPHYRMAIILKYLEELDYREIARIMEIPQGTVGTWIRRGLEKLKTSLQTKGGFDNEKILAK